MATEAQPLAWDTTLLSQLAPGRRSAAAFLAARERGEPVYTTAISVMEVLYGHARRRDERFDAARDYLLAQIDEGAVHALGFTAEAAGAAAAIRANVDVPGQRRARGRQRSQSRAEYQIGWVLDMQIAATAWVAGVGIATANVNDFEVLARALQRAFPGVEPLRVAPEAG